MTFPGHALWYHVDRRTAAADAARKEENESEDEKAEGCPIVQ